MRVQIETILHEEQRYTTVGDWFLDDSGKLIIRVSQLSDWRREMLIAIHELIEWFLCQNSGIDQKTVDKFDMEFKGDDEPGDDPKAPYVKQHCIATGIERLLCAELGISWKEYEQELCELPDVK